EPLDQRLAMVEPPTLIRPGRSIPASLWVLIVLAAAVGGVLFFLSRGHARTFASPAASEPAAIPASPTAAVAARPTAPAPIAAIPTTAASARPAATRTNPTTHR